MAKGYFIFTEIIRDQTRYGSYLEKALPTVLRSGGRPIVADDNPDVIEGQWHGPRTVVLEFDTVEAARKWYGSSQYQSLIGERHASAETNAAIVTGIDMSST